MDAARATGAGPPAAGPQQPGDARSPSKTAGSQSRSTSAGSSRPSPADYGSSPSVGRAASTASSPPSKVAKAAVPTLPEYIYPAPFKLPSGGEGSNGSPGDYATQFVVKNTFVDGPSDTPQSLERFFQQREIRSCPPGAIGAPPGLRIPIPEAGSLHDRLFPEADAAVGTDPLSLSGAGASHCASSLAAGFLDIEYPSPFTIKNTFVESPGSAPTSLAGFFQEHEVRPAPGSGLGGPPGLDDDMEGAAADYSMMMAAAAAMQSQFVSTPFSSAIYEQSMYAADAAAYAAVAAMEFQAGWSPQSLKAMSPLSPDAKAFAMPPDAKAEPAKPLKLLRIAEAIPEPALGSPEMPTVGSAGHRLGNCKPCAFMHTKGCGNGVECPFCHVCAPGERKRRQKQRIAATGQGEAQQQKVSLWNSLQESGLLGAVPPPR